MTKIIKYFMYQKTPKNRKCLCKKISMTKTENIYKKNIY